MLHTDHGAQFDTGAALIAGPCALPEAPMAMPRQQLEAPAGVLSRLLSGLGLRPAATGLGH